MELSRKRERSYFLSFQILRFGNVPEKIIEEKKGEKKKKEKKKREESKRKKRKKTGAFSSRELTCSCQPRGLWGSFSKPRRHSLLLALGGYFCKLKAAYSRY